MKAEQREVELKYRVEDDALWAALHHDERLLDRFKLTPRRSQKSVDIYWDTADYALARGGFGLRTRRQDDAWLVTLKELTLSPDSALADRVEVECTVDAATVAAFLHDPQWQRLRQALAGADWPPAAFARVHLHKRQSTLRPLIMVDQMRDKRMVIGVDGDISQHVGELSVDAVQIYAPPADLSTLPDIIDQRTLATFREVEIEAVTPDQIGQIHRLATILDTDARFVPSPGGKAESALRAAAQVDADGRIALSATLSMAEAGRLIWRQQLIEVILNEVGVRCHQNGDAVHDMRVAIRRMRAAQRIFGPYFAPKTIKPLLRMLRKTAKILGAARDLDVALARLDSYEIDLPAVRVDWQQQRQQAYAEAERWLASKAYSRFIAAFDHFCRRAGMGVRHRDADDPLRGDEVRHAMPAEIFAHYTNMRRYESVIADATLPMLHQLRIEGKRLRYALEFVAPLLDPTITPTLIADLKRVQDLLGDINDATVMGDRLRRFAGDHPQISVDHALAQLDQVIAEKRASFAPLWAAFVGAETRNRIALAIAYL